MKKIRTLNGHNENIMSLCVMNNHLLASASYDTHINLLTMHILES